MLAALRLLTMICLLWCAIGVTVSPPVDDGSMVQRLNDGLAFAKAAHDDGCAPAQAGHHHCPVAPILRSPSVAPPLASATPPLFMPDPVVLASLTRAPPLQPPAA